MVCFFVPFMVKAVMHNTKDINKTLVRIENLLTAQAEQQEKLLTAQAERQK
jgi:hypothetical protein